MTGAERAARLAPVAVGRPWGGVRLSDRLPDDTPRRGEGPVGEAWCVSAHPHAPSPVVAGRGAGRTLDAVLADDHSWLPPALAPDGRLSLLVKVLDSARRLSLQVHPDDDLARELGEADTGKAEAWWFLDVDDGVRAWCGLRDGCDADDLAAALDSADPDTALDVVLRRVPVTAGDWLEIPPGTLHALPGGVLLLEVQQSSDLTYRLHDWGRLPAREVHLDRGLRAIRAERRPAPTAAPADAGRAPFASDHDLPFRAVREHLDPGAESGGPPGDGGAAVLVAGTVTCGLDGARAGFGSGWLVGPGSGHRLTAGPDGATLAWAVPA